VFADVVKPAPVPLPPVPLVAPPPPDALDDVEGPLEVLDPSSHAATLAPTVMTPARSQEARGSRRQVIHRA
jgi:hypothetical protein